MSKKQIKYVIKTGVRQRQGKELKNMGSAALGGRIKEARLAEYYRGIVVRNKRLRIRKIPQPLIFACKSRSLIIRQKLIFFF